jgi:hypothetical protein
MAGDRFVLLGLARPRATWFGEVSRWATTAIVAAEFVKCVSAEELRARVQSGRRWSAALLDGSLPAVDRDLLAGLRDAGCAPIVVDDRDRGDRWRAIGAAAVLPSTFDRGALLDVLESVAVAVSRAAVSGDDAFGEGDADRGGALVVAACGPGGTGASTIAAAIAQGLARRQRATVLADLARNAEQAVLHDVREVVPGIQELVEAHRSATLTDDDVRALTFSIVERGYSLLLGLRRARYWPVLRPRSFAAAFSSLCRAYDAVVCDVTADVESEDDGGSTDVEERNVAARTAVLDADVVLVVGRAGVKGVHALVRVLGEMVSAGVESDRLLPVITMAPRSPRARAEVADALGELRRPALGGGASPSPIFVPAKNVEQCFRDGVALPGAVVDKVTDAALAVAARAGVRHRAGPEPALVAPGSLGSFTAGFDDR